MAEPNKSLVSSNWMRVAIGLLTLCSGLIAYFLVVDPQGACAVAVPPAMLTVMPIVFYWMGQLDEKRYEDMSPTLNSAVICQVGAVLFYLSSMTFQVEIDAARKAFKFALMEKQMAWRDITLLFWMISVLWHPITAAGKSMWNEAKKTKSLINSVK
jgi:hypothetical protein